MSAPPAPSYLLRVLGVGFGLAVTIGNSIGSGILRTPGQVAEALPSVWPFLAVWVAGGLYALLGAVSLAELGAMMPRSGGQYVFARHAFGRYAGFVVGWNDWIATCGSAAAAALTIAQYGVVFLAVLAPHTVPAAVAVVLAFALLQWRGIGWGALAQTGTSLIKGVVLLALVAACFLLAGQRPDAVIEPAGGGGLPLAVRIVLALQAVIFTYDGWTGVIYFSEEVRDPGRDIPRSMLGGVLTVMAIYLLLNVAFLSVVPIGRMAGDDFVVGTVARELFGPAGDTVVRTIMVLALLSAVNAFLLMAPRVLFAMARDGLVSSRASAVNAGGTPTVSLLISAVVAALFILSGTFEQVIAVMSFFFVANYAISFAALFVLRRREPGAPRPYRTWGYPWTTGAALVGSLAFLVGAVVGDPRTSAYAFLLLVLSYPAFLLSQRVVGRTTRNE